MVTCAHIRTTNHHATERAGLPERPVDDVIIARHATAMIKVEPLSLPFRAGPGEADPASRPL
ncbi:hypothetical protein Ait01nite_039450 [Actinoplanes italicus]|nr:hypothetical protein Ait01nite_039450 [Actinoplanes italicus]